VSKKQALHEVWGRGADLYIARKTTVFRQAGRFRQDGMVLGTGFVHEGLHGAGTIHAEHGEIET
jgi:hypothetical protein